MDTAAYKFCEQFLRLCAKPEHQTTVMKEKGLLTAATKHLGNPNEKVVFMAARAIYFLSNNPTYRPALTMEPTLLDMLRKLVTSEHDRIRTTAVKIITNLTSTPKISEDAENRRPAAKAEKPRPVTIHIDGVGDDARRRAVEKALINVPGVVSLTINKAREQAIVYTKSKKEIRPLLLDALKAVPSATVEAAPAVRKPFTAIAEPRYIDDEEDETVFGKGTVTHNHGWSSLESRLAKRRAEEASRVGKTEKVKRLFSSITSVFGW